MKDNTKIYYYIKTYELTAELKSIGPILEAAVDYQQQNERYPIPYSYWTDNRGWLYIRWQLYRDCVTMPVWRYRFGDGHEIIAEEIPRRLSKAELLHGKDADNSAVLITGDTHRKFDRLQAFSKKYGTKKDDLMIILGDAGINYYGGRDDDGLKYRLSKLGMTLFCIHGNHEMRPESTGLYAEKEWNGGKVYVEDRYPDLLFAKDGEIYDIAGFKVLVIGGAYSVDKYYRQSMGYHWFSDEQPSDETKAYVEKQLDQVEWEVDVVLSHTVPYKYRPTDLFIKDLDQSTVDESTEIWLGEIEKKLRYKKWYAGHYHTDRDIDRLTIMYGKVQLFMNETDLKFSLI